MPRRKTLCTICKMTRHATFIVTISLALTACSNQTADKSTTAVSDTTATIHTSTVLNCDTFSLDKPKTKDYKKALKVWLEDCTLDWFLKYRQPVWGEAKAWHIKTFSIDSNSFVKCLTEGKKNIFLYIPNHFYIQEKNGNEYFQFFIVNNSADTIQIPRIDKVINNISSFISTGDTSKWISFQQTTMFVDCGNSYWTMKLAPKTAIESQIECDYLNLGDTTVDYRLELSLGKQTITSNRIKVNLMRKQLQFIGKNFD